MKLYEIDNSESIADKIEKDCQPWIQKVNPTNFVYRGMKIKDPEHIQIINTRKDRKPKDSSWNKHHLLNILIENAGLSANRNNSAFVTSQSKMARKFGTVFIFYPIGDFNYTWSPYNSDFFQTLELFGNVLSITKENFEDIKQILLKKLNFSKFEKPPYEWENYNVIKSEVNFETFLQTVQENLGTNYILNYFDISDYHLNKWFRGDDGSLKNAVDSGHEIMIECEKYYIIRSSYKEFLKEEFEKRGY